MSLLSVLIIVIVMILLLWIINRLVPIDVRIRRAIGIVVVVLICIWLLSATGVFDYLGSVRLR